MVVDFFGNDWVRSWSDPFNSIGVEPFSNEPGKILMPAPDADGAALKEPWRVTRFPLYAAQANQDTPPR